MTAQETQRLGQQIGNYRLISLLGKGGFADVYLGEHIYLQTQSAIKILRVQLSDDALQDFLTEAQTIARLDHPNIVRVFDYGVQEDTPFLVMNYAPNGSLRKRYPRHARLPLTELVPIIHQIASALDYAHQLKLIHRDIKPENMLIGQQQQVLLSDFGLALSATGSTSQAAINTAGTVPYMAPEQLQGKVRYTSDQYALGIVAYEWLCGERPFNGSFPEIASQHVLAPPPSLCERVPDLPPAVEQVVLKALAKDPTQRFENVQAFAQALQQASQFPAMRRSTSLFMPIPLPNTSTNYLQSAQTAMPSSSEIQNDYITSPMPDLHLSEKTGMTQGLTNTAHSTHLGGTQTTTVIKPTTSERAASIALPDITQSSSMPTKQHASHSWQLPVIIVLVLLLIGGGIGVFGYRLLQSSTPSQSSSAQAGFLGGNKSFLPKNREATPDRIGKTASSPITRTIIPPQGYPTPMPNGADVPSAAAPGSPAATPLPDCIKGSNTSLTFTSLLNQTTPPAPRTVTLTNCGKTSAIWVSAVQMNNGMNWLNATPSTGRLAPGEDENILVRISNVSTIGTYTGTVIIAERKASWTITVTYIVLKAK